MRIFLIVLFFCTIGLNAQELPKFENYFIDCIDKWVILPKDDDSTYLFGFVYLDEEAGLTLNTQSYMHIDTNGKYVSHSPNTFYDSVSVKTRIRPNGNKIAIIPKERFEEMRLNEFPEWLSIYIDKEYPEKRLYRLGFEYNIWRRPNIAMEYLEKALQIAPKNDDIKIELGYTYNSLGLFEKAAKILQEAVKTSPDNCFLYKELTYAETRMEQLPKAIETSRKGISLCNDSTMKAEMAFNITGQFYRRKDKANFKIWADETKKWAEKESKYLKNIELMEFELKD